MKSLCSGSSVLNHVIVFTLICIKDREKWKGKKKKSCCILFCSFFSCSGSEVLTFCVLNGYELSCLPWCCNFAPNGSGIHNPQFTLNLQGEELPIELEFIGIFCFPFQNHKICLSFDTGTWSCASWNLLLSIKNVQKMVLALL